MKQKIYNTTFRHSAQNQKLLLAGFYAKNGFKQLKG